MEHPHEAVSRAILDRRAELAEAIVSRQYQEQPQVWQRYGNALESRYGKP